MERAEYEALADKMQRLAREDPEAYRRKVMRWARGGTLGYWGIFLLALLLAIIIAMIMVYGEFVNGLLVILTLGILVGAAGMLRRVPDPEPTHLIELPPDKAPEYHRIVSELGAKMKAPKVDVLAVSPSFNASAQYQKLLFRRPRYVVEAGFLLLATFSPEEARAVIAHELAHHVSDDARDGRKINRLYTRWELAAQSVQHSSLLAAIAKGFVEWYFPRFAAITGAYRLQCELDADRRAAEAVSAEALGSGLLRLIVTEEFVIEPLWRRHLDDLVSHGLEAFKFNESFQSGANSETIEDPTESMRLGLQRTTTIDDSHPASRERLENIGVHLGENPNYSELAASAVTLPKPSAAEAFFGPDLGWVATRLDDLVRILSADSLREEIERRRKARDLVDQPLDTPTTDRLLERAHALLSLSRSDEALDVAEQAFRLDPNNADVRMTRGILLLAVGDESGLQALHQLAADNPGFAALAHQQMAMYMTRHGRSNEARNLMLKAEELGEIQEKKQNRLVDLSNELDWYPHRASPEEVQAFSNYCRNFPFILTAYIVERRDAEWTDFKLQVGLLVFEPPAVYIDENSAISSFISKMSQSGLDAPFYCYTTLPKLKAAKHAAQYVPPVYVREPT